MHPVVYFVLPNMSSCQKVSMLMKKKKSFQFHFRFTEFPGIKMLVEKDCECHDDFVIKVQKIIKNL